MKIHTKEFRVREGDKLKLKKWPTRVKSCCETKEEYLEVLAGHVKKLSARQELFYADRHYALLLVFQAMDAGGKDGAIKHVMSGVNPQGCQVYSFKEPSAEERAHDFLWRTNRCLPERGNIGLFNRSYYEETLIVRVHPDILAAQNLPREITQDKKFWEHRYDSINDLEKHLYRNGTRVVKFFLHISKEEQKKRFLARIDDPAKNWKLGPADIKERALWQDYMAAYEDCISATSTDHAPWYVVPADDKHNARLIVSQIIMDTLDDLKLNYPDVDKQRRADLQASRKLLVK